MLNFYSCFCRFRNLGTKDAQLGSNESVYIFEGFSLLSHIDATEGSLQAEDMELTPKRTREDENRFVFFDYSK